jgi:hypothetical protein
VRDDAERVDPAESAERADEATLDAVHRVEVAVEWIERAFGALLDAHHRVGHAQGLMLEAAAALREAGHPELAERARLEVAPLDAVAGRWTYQVVDEFRSHLLDPARAFDAAVRERLAGGVRHRAEALQKRRAPGTASPTSVTLRGSAAQGGAGAPSRTREEPSS